MPWQVAGPQPLLSLRTFLVSRPVLQGKRRFLATSEAVHSGGSSAAGEPADRRPRQLFQGGRPVLCLERAVGERAGLDEELWGSGEFSAQVYPDLPVATSWRDLLRLAGSAAPDGGGLPAGGVPPNGRWLVQTVAAQCRSRGQLRSLTMEAAGVDGQGEPVPGARGADALLFVSGSHPARSLPGVSRWLQNSVGLLQAAAALRAAGRLPASLSLWAVENPMLSPPSRLAAKAAAGAEVVLTQPPLLWGRSERWAHAAHEAGLTAQVRVVVGVAMASSAANLDFWLRLAGVRGLPEAEALLASFPCPGGGLGKEGCAAAVRAWNVDLINKTLALPGVSGLHVMPLTAAARRLALDLLADGTLPRNSSSGSDAPA